jgi:pyruvate carboxylase
MAEEEKEFNKIPTPEEIQKSISAAMDSVSFITKKIAEAKTEERVKGVNRNIKHLEHMLTKEWFSGALSTQQRTDIDTSITDGKAYCS